MRRQGGVEAESQVVDLTSNVLTRFNRPKIRIVTGRRIC